MKQIEEKFDYYQRQLQSNINKFIRTNKREDRDRVITTQSKIQAFKEVIEILQNDKNKI